MICRYWFFNHGLKFQDFVCNGCHNLTMLIVNISDIAIITIKNVDYRCIIHNINKSEAINLLKKYVLENREYVYKKYCLNSESTQSSLFSTFLFIYKMVDSEYSMSIYISLKISIGILRINPEMLKLIPDHLKIKTMVSMQLKNYLIY